VWAWLLVALAIAAAAAAAKKGTTVLNPGRQADGAGFDGSVTISAAGTVTTASVAVTLVAYERFTNNPSGDGSTIGMVPLDQSESPINLTTSGLYRDHWPRANPSGTKLLFGRSPKNTTGNTPPQIWTMNVDGSGQTRIMSLTSGDKQNDENTYIEWGHHEWIDDDTIVFGAHASGDTSFAIWKCDANGMNHVRLTDGTIIDIDPSVTPDGRIVFIRGFPLGNQEIWIMDADGSNQTRISNDSTIDFDPYVSPDGTRIINLTWPSLQFDNWLRDIDGTNIVNVADGSAEGSYSVAQWVTDSQIITARVVPFSNGSSLVTFDPDAPGVKTAFLTSDATTRYRDVCVFDGVWPT
jgi:hypothetical protein